ncbi:MAG TPA: siroheme synthase CysG [Acetobacteraceae bacterium]|nr:siroheme synthase CysG [Acetobacteraceae bacterium]
MAVVRPCPAPYLPAISAGPARMQHFPVFLDLKDRPVLVLGSGEIAARKADLLRRAGAAVHASGHFTPDLLTGCALAVGAGAPEADLQALAAAARAAGIPCNVVDRPELCSFIMPAVIERDPITIAVSSAGVAPVLARLLRARIEAAVPPGFGRLAALAARFRDEIRRRLPDLATRRRVLERLFTGPAADLVFAGREAEAEAAFARALDTGDAAEGIVFLVGGGPGAADLLTLRAQRLLGEADVIVHDRLVGDAVLDLARRDAARIYVGKVRAKHCLPQEGINDLLIRLAREGRRVVRLKGGDPFIFGRGGEEAEALAAAGVRCEVVPGVTAALACAAQEMIPLTHRGVARSVTFVTGHTREGRLDIDFGPLVRARTTLAVYMGIVSLPQLRDGLLAHGLDPATPAALIERGGTPQHRALRGTLDELVARAPDWSTGGPALVLVGEAVARGGTRTPAAQATPAPA